MPALSPTSRTNSGILPQLPAKVRHFSLEALLWAFHNAKSGVCFPSYETIAEAAGCTRSTVAEALKALEDAGILSWVHRQCRHQRIRKMAAVHPEPAS
jgi:AraC-like DNA-binding protein